MREIRGDLLELAENGDFDVIVHGCNCFSKMGAGIAKQIKNKWLEVYEIDKETIMTPHHKLGSFTYAEINDSLTVVNAYTQLDFVKKWGVINADYEAIRSVFSKIKIHFSGKRIAYPMIGAGLAGGDWSVISQIIDEELEGENHTLVLLGR